MIGKLWNLLFILGLAATAWSFFTGKGINGVPVTSDKLDCQFLADHFTGESLKYDYRLTKIQRIDELQELRREPARVECLGLTWFDGTPASFMLMIATGTGAKGYETSIGQPGPADYTCPLLAREVVMKFSGESFGDSGRLMEITGVNGSVTGSGAAAKLSCAGRASWSAGSRGQVSFSWDGENFRVDPF